MIYVVTGTSRGIGLELVRQLADRGDHVVATAREPSESSELQELAKAHGESITVVQMDVRDQDSIKARIILCRSAPERFYCFHLCGCRNVWSVAQAAAKTIEEKHPNGVDVLINDAGINSPFQRACEQCDTITSCREAPGCAFSFYSLVKGSDGVAVEMYGPCALELIIISFHMWIVGPISPRIANSSIVRAGVPVADQFRMSSMCTE